MLQYVIPCDYPAFELEAKLALGVHLLYGLREIGLSGTDVVEEGAEVECGAPLCDGPGRKVVLHQSAACRQSLRIQPLCENTQDGGLTVYVHPHGMVERRLAQRFFGKCSTSREQIFVVVPRKVGKSCDLKVGRWCGIRRESREKDGGVSRHGRPAIFVNIGHGEKSGTSAVQEWPLAGG